MIKSGGNTMPTIFGKYRQEKIQGEDEEEIAVREGPKEKCEA